MQTIEERIEALERSNRRLRGAGIVCGMLLVVGLVVGANQTPTQELGPQVHDVLRAKQIEVVNDRGEALVWIGQLLDSGGVLVRTHLGERVFDTRLDLGLTVSSDTHKLLQVAPNILGSGQISVYNKNGKELFSATAAPNGAGAIALQDGHGNTLIGTGADDNGNGTLAISGQGRPIVFLGANKNNEGSIRTVGSKGEYSVIISSVGGVGGVATFGPQETRAVEIGASEDGSGLVRTFCNGQATVTIGSSAGGNGYVLTSDSQGRKLVELDAVKTDDIAGGQLLRTGFVAVHDPSLRTAGGTLTTIGVIAANGDPDLENLIYKIGAPIVLVLAIYWKFVRKKRDSNAPDDKQQDTEQQKQGGRRV